MATEAASTATRLNSRVGVQRDAADQQRRLVADVKQMTLRVRGHDARLELVTQQLQAERAARRIAEEGYRQEMRAVTTRLDALTSFLTKPSPPPPSQPIVYPNFNTVPLTRPPSNPPPVPPVERRDSPHRQPADPSDYEDYFEQRPLTQPPHPPPLAAQRPVYEKYNQDVPRPPLRPVPQNVPPDYEEFNRQPSPAQPPSRKNPSPRPRIPPTTSTWTRSPLPAPLQRHDPLRQLQPGRAASPRQTTTSWSSQPAPRLRGFH